MNGIQLSLVNNRINNSNDNKPVYTNIFKKRKYQRDGFFAKTRGTIFGRNKAKKKR